MDPKLVDLLASIGELLANLTDLSAEQLSALTDQLSQAIDALSGSDATDAVVASAGTLADAAEQVAAERSRREALVASASDLVGRARGALRRPTPVPISQVVASAAGRRDPERERPDDAQSDGRVRASLTAGGNPNSPVHGAAALAELAELFAVQHRAARSMKAGSDGERVVVASARWDYPEANDLRRGDADMVSERMDNVVTSMVASGGICRPVNVDYAIPTWANLERPVRDSLPSFQATRGGIHYIAPQPFDMAVFGPAVGIWTAPNDVNPGGANTGVNSTRTVTDAVTAVGTTLTSATAAFTYADVGRSVTGGSIPAGATIASVQSGTSVTLSAAATAAANGVAITVSGIGTGPTTKPCIEMNCGTEMEVLVEAITQCVTISNFRARFAPEQLSQALTYVGQAHSVTAEIELLRQMRAFAKHVSGTQLFGYARDSLVTLSLVNAYFRDKYRMSQNTMLRVVLKRWVKDAVRADLTKAAFPTRGAMPTTA